MASQQDEPVEKKMRKAEDADSEPDEKSDDDDSDSASSDDKPAPKIVVEKDELLALVFTSDEDGHASWYAIPQRVWNEKLLELFKTGKTNPRAPAEEFVEAFRRVRNSLPDAYGGSDKPFEEVPRDILLRRGERRYQVESWC